MKVLLLLVGVTVAACGKPKSSPGLPPSSEMVSEDTEGEQPPQAMPEDSGFTNQTRTETGTSDSETEVPDTVEKPTELPASTPAENGTYDAALVAEKVAQMDAAIKARVDGLREWKIADDWYAYPAEKRALYEFFRSPFDYADHVNYDVRNSDQGAGYQCGGARIEYKSDWLGLSFKDGSSTYIRKTVNLYPSNGKLYVTHVELEWKLSTDAESHTYTLTATCTQ